MCAVGCDGPTGHAVLRHQPAGRADGEEIHPWEDGRAESAVRGQRQGAEGSCRQW